jgi:hypothetical protein
MLSRDDYSKYINELNEIKIELETDPFKIGVEKFTSILDDYKKALNRINAILVQAIQNKIEIKGKFETANTMLEQKINALLVNDENVRREKSVESRRAACLVKLHEEVVKNAALEQDLLLADSLLTLAKRVYANLRLQLIIMSEQRSMFQLGLALEGKAKVLTEPTMKVHQLDEDMDVHTNPESEN